MASQERCTQHANKVQRICLQKDCEDRLMCLLCQHQHDTAFKSILTKTSQSYQRFKNIVNQQIDIFLEKQQKSDEAKIQEKQIQIIQTYYGNLIREIGQFLKFHKLKTVQKLKGNKSLLIEQLKRVRILGNHYRSSANLFKMLMEVYQGQTIDSFFKSESQARTQQSHQMMLSAHKCLKKLMEDSSYRSKMTFPDVRSVVIQSLPQKRLLNFEKQSYAEEFKKTDLVINIKYQSSCEFNSIISDVLSLKDFVMVSSYDKSLRIFDKKLNILAEHQYENILTQMHQIDSEQELFAIAQSKQLLVQKISIDNHYEPKRVMKLRGHGQRINQIDAYNTRIIGSSSDQGTKIWDLYKEKCEYTFREDANPTVFSFLPKIKALTIGYNDHTVRMYSIQTLKSIRKWPLDGVPLFVSHQKLNESIFYLSGFPSNLVIVDTRLKNLALNHNFKSQAVTCFCQSIYQQGLMILGQRGGKARLFELSKLRQKNNWDAHQGKTNLSKPNGVVKVFEEGENEYLTAGANDKKLKIWQIRQHSA